MTEEIRVHVLPFNFGTMGEKVLKPLEEAAEIRAAYQYGSMNDMLYEICDTIQACVNVAMAAGFKPTELNDMMATVTLNNMQRGRYGRRD